jgi:hypothetical protein
MSLETRVKMTKGKFGLLQSYRMLEAARLFKANIEAVRGVGNIYPTDFSSLGKSKVRIFASCFAQ